MDRIPKSLLSTVEEAFADQGGQAADASPAASKQQPTLRTSLPFDEGHHVFRVDGPITVFHQGRASPSDGIAYRVFWEQLDEHGDVIPGYNKLAKDTPMDGGQMSERPYKPPFDNPYGWRVHISIPPQGAYSGSSNGVYL